MNMLEDIFGTRTGVLWLAITSKEGKITQYSGDNPRPADELEEFIALHQDRNQYFCVNLTETHHGRREANVLMSSVVYADLDDKCVPADLLVYPTWVVRTSEEKYQAFWVMEDALPADVTSGIARRIAAYHKLDACWDKVRLMRLPGSLNYKYETPYPVHVVAHTHSRFRLSDFTTYPNVAFKYLAFETNSVSIADSPQYEDLDIVDQQRVDNYTSQAVQEELLKLAELAALAPGEKYLYHSVKGLQEFGWERGCMWVARCLTELANSPWNDYTLETAQDDFLDNAPTDMTWTHYDNYKKWQAALNSNCGTTIKYRKYPQSRGL